MVRIKFTAHPKIPMVSSEPELMASDEVPEVFAEQLEASTPQAEKSLTDQQKGALTKTGSPCGVDSDCERWFDDSRDNETTSNNSGCLKVAAAAALAGISYDFGPSKIMKTHIGSMESYAHYFPKGYGRPPGAESVLEPRANKAVIFEDFFTVGLRMLLHPVFMDILLKFQVQLHHLTSNAIVQISKFIWAVTSYGGHLTVDVFAQHYELHYQNKKIHLEGCETTLTAEFGCITFHSAVTEGGQSLPLM
jgi:hypothetical protein